MKNYWLDRKNRVFKEKIFGKVVNFDVEKFKSRYLAEFLPEEVSFLEKLKDLYKKEMGGVSEDGY